MASVGFSVNAVERDRWSRISDPAIRELLERSYELPSGPARLATLEEAVRHADTLGDENAGFLARLWLIKAAVFGGGKPDRAVVAFSWVLARHDAAPTLDQERCLLWDYKWIIDECLEYPQITRAQLFELLEDFRRRMHEGGYNLHPYLQLRARTHLAVGETDQAQEYFRRWLETDRGVLSDCRACDLNFQVEILVSAEQHEEAIRRAKPIIAGQQRCGYVPQSTFNRLMTSYLKLDRLEAAKPLMETGYRLAAGEAARVGDVAQYILYLLRAGNRRRAVSLFERHLPDCRVTNIPRRILDFYAAAAVLMQSSKSKTRKFRIDRELPIYKEDGQYRVDDLRDWFQGETDKLAGQFDARAGSDYCSRQLEIRRSLVLP